MNQQPLVSIIIPTYNSEATVKNCLESIKKQTYKNIETIVVDGFSRDKTTNIIKEYGTKLIKIKGERTKAKNIGLKHAKGKYVLFIDSDMELTPKVVEECVSLAKLNPRIGGIIIPEKSAGEGFRARGKGFERSFYEKTPIESARFFRKDLVLRAGGYDEDIIFFEESTLPHKIEKLGYSTKARITSYIIHNEGYFSLRKQIMKKYYYSKTAWRYVKKYRGYGKQKMDPIYRIILFIRNKKFYSEPHLSLGILILKMLEYTVSVLGYLIGKWDSNG